MSSPGTDVDLGTSLGGEPAQGGPPGLGTAGFSFRGPAFAPISVTDLEGFVNRFGKVSAQSFASLAVEAWLSNTSGCTFIRLLGIGNGENRIAADKVDLAGENLPRGAVENSGFIVGSRLTGSSGFLSSNPFAYAGGLPGRTFFLGAFMSESEGSDYFTGAGIQQFGSNTAAPILRGVIFAASGVLPAMSGCYTGNASTASAGPTVGSFSAKQDGGSTIGAVNLAGAARETFVMLLNGHKNTEDYPNIITASFNKATTDSDGQPLYFPGVFNTDPTKINQAGHYLYSYYDIPESRAIITGSGVVTAGTGKLNVGSDLLEECAFLVTSSIPRNASDSAGSLSVPNFENFSDRYATARSPTVISQFLNRQQFDLFRFYARDDGDIGNKQLKITIRNINPPEKKGMYGTFDVMIRALENEDAAMAPISGSENFIGCDLDPSSDSYIAKVIGDAHFYYNFDTSLDRQRFVKVGNHPNRSQFVRVEVDPAVEDQTLPPKILPAGYRGFGHLITSGSSIMSNPVHPLGASPGSEVVATSTNWAHKVIEPPIPYRTQIAKDVSAIGASKPEMEGNFELCWGIQTSNFHTVKSPNTDPNFNESFKSYSTYFPSFTKSRQKAYVDKYGVSDSDGTVYDVDRFNNNKFSLENILIHTRSKEEDIVDENQWEFAKYRRDRKKVSLFDKTLTTKKSGVRFLNFQKDVIPSNIEQIRDYLKFTFMLQGGFDGTNIFSEEKQKFLNLASYFELLDSAQGGKSGPTTSAYLTALKMMRDKSEVDMSILALPGIRVEAITSEAMFTAEDRFDTFYVMDLEELASGSGNVVTSSNDIPSPSLTAEHFRSRALDTTFTATYFPDVQAQDPAAPAGTLVFVPPSISALRVYSRLDSEGSYSSPAGIVRGVIDAGGITAIQTKVRFTDTEKETVKTLYDVAINPIITSDEGLVLFGQRTLFTSADSMLQRVAVRRMIIDIRRSVRATAKNMIFQQNTEEMLANFKTMAESDLLRAKLTGGISRYKVVIDETTTTQADIEANTIRGKVFVQPTKSDEILQIDFVT